MDDETPRTGQDAALVRYLKWLVTALSVTMIAGFIVLVTVVVMRFNQGAGGPAFPDSIALPAGVTAQAVTRGPDYLLVVGTEGRVFVLSTDGQELRQEIEIAR
ncbi:MAG: hypothetical protein KDK28_21390 [Maritimibacter sp.]|nr:hypothetical protein [Maritimibacter sp.]